MQADQEMSELMEFNKSLAGKGGGIYPKRVLGGKHIMDRDQIIKGKRMQPKDSSPQKLISPIITPKKRAVPPSAFKPKTTSP